MTVYLLKREDQNQHGSIDVSIIGIFGDEKDAKQEEAVERTKAREEGLRIEDEDDNDGDWDVCWCIEDHQLQ